MEPQDKFDYELLKRKALMQLFSGKPLFGKDGAFAPMLKDFLDTALQGELDAHLDQEQRVELGNRKNGRMPKQLKTSQGTIEISTPRDRLGSFEPQLVRKRETILADSLEEKILGLYGLGMSLRDISSHIKEMYDTEISASVLSSITDRIIPQLEAWRSRPLEELYTIMWLDAMYFKVREEGRIVTRCVYSILGVGADGRKEVLGLYVSESEGAHFWLTVLTDLQQRGVKDILIACIDGLHGFAEAIAAMYPKAEVQGCVVHQIRNSIKYLASKDIKTFLADLKQVYQAPGKQAAEQQLAALENKWGEKYPKIIESWKRNWEKLSTYFKYPEPIRRLIYTTNTIEGFHRQIRKVTKTKGAFTSDMALLKLIYLAQERITQKWTHPLWNWNQILSQLIIFFPDRIQLDLK
jgi:transposase-like protein